MSNPCLQGGSCQDIGDDFKCDCPQGRAGKTCKYNDFCTPNPCKNNGTCSNDFKLARFKCKCKHQFEGQSCTMSCKFDVNITAFLCNRVKPVTITG